MSQSFVPWIAMELTVMGEITPWMGLGDVSFGKSRTELRNLLGEDQSFHRSPGQPLIDHYLEAGLMLGFDASDRLNFIECTHWAEPSFNGVLLAGRPFGDVLEDLRQVGVNFELDGVGCELTGLGIALYTPAPDELDVDVEGVSVSSREYHVGENHDVARADISDSDSSGSESSQQDMLF
jgi:hypothetical protein